MTDGKHTLSREQLREFLALRPVSSAGQPPVVTRFCPSVTGPLHLGHGVNFWCNYLHAKQRGGQMLCMIEVRDWSCELPGIEYAPDWYAGAVRSAFPERDPIERVLRFLYGELRHLPAYFLPFVIVGTGGRMQSVVNSLAGFQAWGWQWNPEIAWNCSPARVKAHLQARIGINAIVRGRDCAGNPELEDADEQLRRLIAPRELTTLYHPVVTVGGMKLGSALGAHKEYTLQALYAPMRCSGVEVTGPAVASVSIRVLAPLLYLLGCIDGELPAAAELFERCAAFSVEAFCGGPDLEWSDGLWARCVVWLQEVRLV